MESQIQQQLLNQGPFAAVLGGMLLLGSLINFNQTNPIVEPQKEWCQNNTLNVVSNMPQGLNVVTALLAVIFPMTPLVLNSQAKHWNRFKFEMAKTHVAGQSSVFGMSEVLRHILTIPETTFLNKCNITLDECINKTYVKLVQPLLNKNDSNISFCKSQSNNLFDSLHHFPDITCCLIGASFVSFLATLYFWNRANTNGKSIYEAHSLKQYILIIFQMLFVIVVLSYIYFLCQSFDSMQLYGMIIGGFVQFLIVCSTLPKKVNVDV